MRRSPAATVAGLLLILLLPGARTGAQPAESESVADLRSRAEQAFENDDAETAILLYRRLSQQLVEPLEKARVLITLAWVEHLGGMPAGATLSEAVQLAPDLPFREELYSDDFVALFRDTRRRAQAERERLTHGLLRRGVDEMRRRNYDAARRVFQEALDKAPDHPQGLYNLALVDLYDSRNDDALAGFQKLLDLHSRNPGAVSDPMLSLVLVNVGYVHNARRDFAEAEIVLQRATEVDPDNAGAWSNLGVTRRNLGKLREAAEAFRRAYSLDSNDPSVMNNLALTYIDGRDWVSAAALLREATSRFPGDASLWLNLGRAQVGLGNPTDAVQSFGEAIRLDAANAGGWAAAAALELAKVYYEAGAYEKALAELERTLSWRRDHTEAWIYQGLAQKGKGDLDAARGSFEQARQLDPTRAETHNNLGTVTYEIGLLDDAERAFRRALELDPDNQDARRNLEAVTAARASGGGRRPPPAPTSPPPSRPAPSGPHLGVRFARIDYSAIGLKGAMVESVEPGSNAARAGLRENDLILKVDGRDIAGYEDLEAYVRERARGSSVTLDLLRNNLPQRIAVSLD